MKKPDRSGDAELLNTTCSIVKRLEELIKDKTKTHEQIKRYKKLLKEEEKDMNDMFNDIGFY